VLQSTYIRTVRVGGGRRRGRFYDDRMRFDLPFQRNLLYSFNKHTDYLLI
jgi:hypothetical protein